MAKKFSTFAPKTRVALLAVLISTLLLAIFAAVSCKNSGGLFGKGARPSAGAAAGGVGLQQATEHAPTATEAVALLEAYWKERTQEVQV